MLGTKKNALHVFLDKKCGRHKEGTLLCSLMYLQRLYAQMIEIEDDKFILMQMFFFKGAKKTNQGDKQRHS